MEFDGDNHVLEVGVGTGASLPLYSKSTRVTGIDLSDEAIAYARQLSARINKR